MALGNLLRALGNVPDALQHYRKASSIDPKSAEARWALAITHLRPVYDSVESSRACRRAFAEELSTFNAWIGDTPPAAASAFVGEPPPFYLAYQPENNRELLRIHGSLCSRVMANGIETRNKPRRASGRPLRALVVSAHLYNHSVWNALLKGWFQRHETRPFELESIYLGRDRDDETAAAARLSNRFTAPAGPVDVLAAAKHALGADTDSELGTS
jgi:predicted O-linked N-acetylglucosamine transferase (SPINDLY family)